MNKALSWRAVTALPLVTATIIVLATLYSGYPGSVSFRLGPDGIEFNAERRPAR